MSTYTLAEVLESSGPIMVIDEETGIMITANGAYFNVFCPTSKPGIYRGAETCRCRNKDFYETSAGHLLDEAREYLAEILAGDGE